MKLGRNDPCHCGSGQKYKKCCLDRDQAQRAAQFAAEAAQRRAATVENAQESRPGVPTAPARATGGARPKPPMGPTPTPLRRRAV
ncbi:SEC-C metal-binding domain-containing protein [Sorangium sp. So ce233]|uniref:SEC-C metal-binding domain-containing protein n=1 Tax=Sorangium sp. So ce233 TaxID=3133290 RepID=UPI003F6308C4